MDLTSAKGLGNSIHLRKLPHNFVKLIQNWKKSFMLVSKETAALLKMGETTSLISEQLLRRPLKYIVHSHSKKETLLFDKNESNFGLAEVIHLCLML